MFLPCAICWVYSDVIYVCVKFVSGKVKRLDRVLGAGVGAQRQHGARNSASGTPAAVPGVRARARAALYRRQAGQENAGAISQYITEKPMEPLGLS